MAGTFAGVQGRFDHTLGALNALCKAEVQGINAALLSIVVAEPTSLLGGLYGFGLRTFLMLPKSSWDFFRPFEGDDSCCILLPKGRHCLTAPRQSCCGLVPLGGPVRVTTSGLCWDMKACFWSCFADSTHVTWALSDASPRSIPLST